MSDFDSGLTDQEAARIMAGARTRRAPEPADQTRADVVLTEAEREALVIAWYATGTPSDWQAAVGRILADRLAEAEFHIRQLTASRDHAERRAEAAEATVARVLPVPQVILNTVDRLGSGAEVRMRCVEIVRAALDGERP